MRTLAVDPGIRGVGVAIFDDKTLRRAAYVENREKSGAGPAECVELAEAVDAWVFETLGVSHGHLGTLDTIVVEWPQVYTQGHLKGDPNDLLPLAGVGVAICALARYRHPSVGFVRYLPREWKAQIPKGKIFEERVLSRLEPQERTELERSLGQTRRTVAHNLFDAVGIGLFHLGRFSPRRVFAR